MPCYANQSTLRKWYVGFVGCVCGLAIVFQMLQSYSLFAAIPATYLLPFLPLLAIGSVLWVLSGRYRESISILVVLSILFFGLLWTDSPYEGILVTVSVFTMVAVGASVGDAGDWWLCARMFVVGFLVATAVVSSRYFLHPAGLGQRFGSVDDGAGVRLIEPNQVGTHAAMAMLVALSLWNRRRVHPGIRLDDVVALFGVAAAIMMIILSQSRGTLVAILGTIFVVICLGRAVFFARTWILAMLFTLCGMLYASRVGLSIVERFSGEDISTGSGRTYLWMGAWNLLKNAPIRALFGYGTGDGAISLGNSDPMLFFALSSGQDVIGVASGVYPGELNPHNAVVEWILSFGFVGLFFAIVAMFLAFIRAHRQDRGDMFAVGQGMIALFVLISMTLVAYRMVGVSIACGGMALAYIYHRRGLIGGDGSCGVAIPLQSSMRHHGEAANMADSISRSP